MRRPAVLVILAAIGCGGREYATLDGSRVRLDGGPFPTEDAQLAPPGRPDGGPVLPRADREIVLPYLGPEAIEELQINQQVGSLDVFFSIDTTGSFGGEIDNLQSELRGRVIPTLRERIDDVAFGVGRFEDFPVEPWGAAGDRPFRLLTAITTDEARLASAVARLDQPLGDGGDIPESGAEALFQIATGEGYADLVAPFTSAAPGGGEAGAALVK
ncbi:MAG: hypothetical protein K8H88_34965, partial [Sandaracinaceae bacterium]|nr:hypothetical protein [Sandaracinaceae bacterium]